MIHEFNCETCGKFVRSKRNGSIARFCSIACRGCTKKFQWKFLTDQEKKMHLRRIYESHVVKSEECWDWTASKDKNGYGVVPISKNSGFTKRKAHQISWILNFGEIPNGMLVCHHCDNTSCSRPDHLFLGSPLSNMKDKMRKNRHISTKGSKNGMSKLNESKVKEIKKMYDKGQRIVDLASKNNMEWHAIYNIVNNRTWKHVEV